MKLPKAIFLSVYTICLMIMVIITKEEFLGVIGFFILFMLAMFTEE